MKRTGLSQLGQRTAPPPISWLMKTALDRPRLISLAAGFTDSESLPVEETRELLDQLLSQPKRARAALQYGPTSGDPVLRELTAHRLQSADAIRGQNPAYAADRVLITNGSQQLLYLLLEALCDPGDIVLVDDPTYFVFLGILQSHGLQCRGVKLLQDGLDISALEETCERLKRAGELARVKLLYWGTSFQNPTGLSATLANKAAVLATLRRFERAAGHPIHLLEDAAYRELRFAGPEVPSALALPGAEGRVIYAGTYSKPFATGIRIGYGLLPDPLLGVAARIKANHDFGSPNLLQQILSRALRSGAYQRHLSTLRKRYADKARTTTIALRKHFPESVQWDEPRGGLYVWARGPAWLKTGPRSRFFQAAMQRDVLYVPGEFCYGDDPTRRKPEHEMRLSFGSASHAHLRSGIERLGTVLRQFIKP